MKASFLLAKGQEASSHSSQTQLPLLVQIFPLIEVSLLEAD